MYLPAFRGLRKAGYGVGSGSRWVWEALVGSVVRFKGGSRVGVLAAAGVLLLLLFVARTVAEWALSLLRERLDEAGETGMDEGADMVKPVTAGSVLRDAPLSFALRLSARSLCSVNEGPSVSARVRGGQRGGERRKRGRGWCWCMYLCSSRAQRCRCVS